MEDVNTSVSTLTVLSTVTVMKVMHWRVITVNVEVKKGSLDPCKLKRFWCMHVLSHNMTDFCFTLPYTTTDIPECTTGLHNCTGNAMCVEAVGYFRCVCPANYRIDEDTYASCKGIFTLSYVVYVYCALCCSSCFHRYSVLYFACSLIWSRSNSSLSSHQSWVHMHMHDHVFWFPHIIMYSGCIAPFGTNVCPPQTCMYEQSMNLCM